jgi:hypothetical protein
MSKNNYVKSENDELSTHVKGKLNSQPPGPKYRSQGAEIVKPSFQGLKF